MDAHCRTARRAMQLSMQGQERGQFPPVSLALVVFRAAVGALIGQRVPSGNNLRHRRHDARAQAPAAYHQVAEAIQQAVAHIVFRGGSHNSSPWSKFCFGTAHGP